MITIGSRALRSILAVSTLHLLLAIPARACPAEMKATTAVAPHDASELPMPASHTGHHAATAPVSGSEQAPSPETPATPGSHHMPCCPSSATGCQGGACISTVATLTLITEPAPDAPPVVAPSMTVFRWVSFAHAPEPPPPRT